MTNLATNPDPNNPAGEAPTEAPASGDISGEILETLGLGDSDTRSAAEKIAGKAASTPTAPSAPPAAEEPAGASGAAPTPPAEPSPAPASEAPVTPAAPEPAPAEPPAAPAAQPTAPTAPAAATPPQPPVDERALREASLAAQVDALRRELDTLRANPQAGQPAPGTSPGQPEGPPPVQYGLTLPEETQRRLLSENPQDNIAAITQIINDFGTIVHNAVLKQVRAEVADVVNQLRASGVGGADPASAAREAQKQAYYEKFPSHNNALVLPIIQSENQKMAQEFPGLSWDDNYMNALGARVNAAIAGIAGNGGGQPPAEPTPTPAPAPPAKPAAMMPSAPRSPAAAVPTGDQSQEIIDVLDPFSQG